MTQNIYDKPDFFNSYSQLPRSANGLAGAAEWPALKALLPDLHDLNLVDLGCGFGWFCRWARQQGAAQVLGIDVSEKMLAQARGTTADAAITYAKADLEHLELPQASFDLAYSSLALHYVSDVARLLTTIYRSLVPGGRLVFSIEHPIYMAPANPCWSISSEGHRTWPIDSYLVEGPRTTDWLTKGVVKQHRTLGTTLNLLIQSGFTITKVQEWGPSDQQVQAMPDLAQERDRPMFLFVAAQR